MNKSENEMSTKLWLFIFGHSGVIVDRNDCAPTDMKTYISFTLHSFTYYQFAICSSIFLLYTLSLPLFLFLYVYCSFVHSFSFVSLRMCVLEYIRSNMCMCLCWLLVLLYVKATLLAMWLQSKA